MACWQDALSCQESLLNLGSGWDALQRVSKRQAFIGLSGVVSFATGTDALQCVSKRQAFIGLSGVVSFATGKDALQCVLTTGEG